MRQPAAWSCTRPATVSASGTTTFRPGLPAASRSAASSKGGSTRAISDGRLPGAEQQDRFLSAEPAN